LDFHLLLFRGFQISFGLGLGAQLLDGVHDVRLLSQESITQRLGPFQLFAHHGKNFWKGRQRFHAEVPFHLVQGGVHLVSLQVLVLLHPTVGRHDLQRESGRYQYVSEQGVRVKGYRGKHLVQLFRLICRGCACLLSQDSGWRGKKQNQQRDRSMLTSCRPFHNCPPFLRYECESSDPFVRLRYRSAVKGSG
jgi:hypothetical protein